MEPLTESQIVSKPKPKTKSKPKQKKEQITLQKIDKKPSPRANSKSNTRVSPNAGHVYCISNKMHPGVYKIGTTNDIDARIRALNIGVPEDFVLEYLSGCFYEKFEAEKTVFKLLDQYKCNREFFRCDIAVAINAIKSVENTRVCVQNVQKNQANVPVVPSDQTNVPVVPPEQTNVPVAPIDQINVPVAPPDQTNMSVVLPDQTNVLVVPPDQVRVPAVLQDQTNVPQDQLNVPAVPQDQIGADIGNPHITNNIPCAVANPAISTYKATHGDEYRHHRAIYFESKFNAHDEVKNALPGKTATFMDLYNLIKIFDDDLKTRSEYVGMQIKDIANDKIMRKIFAEPNLFEFCFRSQFLTVSEEAMTNMLAESKLLSVDTQNSIMCKMRLIAWLENSISAVNKSYEKFAYDTLVDGKWVAKIANSIPEHLLPGFYKYTKKFNCRTVVPGKAKMSKIKHVDQFVYLLITLYENVIPGLFTYEKIRVERNGARYNMFQKISIVDDVLNTYKYFYAKVGTKQNVESATGIQTAMTPTITPAQTIPAIIVAPMIPTTDPTVQIVQTPMVAPIIQTPMVAPTVQTVTQTSSTTATTILTTSVRTEHDFDKRKADLELLIKKHEYMLKVFPADHPLLMDLFMMIKNA